MIKDQLSYDDINKQIFKWVRDEQNPIGFNDLKKLRNRDRNDLSIYDVESAVWILIEKNIMKNSEENIFLLNGEKFCDICKDLNLNGCSICNNCGFIDC